MSKKTFRNTAITTMAATATVAAVAPAVSADEVQFSDLEQGNQHYDAVMELVNQGAIDGYEDGTFQPFESVDRGQVAKILANALDLETPENVEELLADYDDVDTDAQYADAVAAVTKANIFDGGEDGSFNSWNSITRQQMAKVLVEAFDLDQYDNGEDVDLNTDEISPEQVDYVQTLANLEITDVPEDFQGYNEISRTQFSSFVVRSQEYVQTVENVDVTANEDGSVTVTGGAPDAVSDGAHVVLANGDDEAVVNEMVDLDEDNNFELTTESLDDGNYKYTVMAMNGEEGHGKANAETGEVDAYTVPAVDSVSAINPSKVEVTFNKGIEALDRDNVTVKDADSGNNQIVKSVELADDGQSANVEFYDALPAESTYNVSVNINDETAEGEIVIGDLEPATIKADAEQTIKAGDADQKVEFTVYDADGVDVTDNYDTDEFNYTSKAVESDGTVALGADASTTTKVQFMDGDKVVAESDDIKLVANEAKADEISNWTTGDADFDSDDYEQKTEAMEDDSLSIEVKDQFGNQLTENDEYTVEYESLDTSVAIVDKNSGNINAVNKTGTVPVKVSVKQDDDVVLTKTVEVLAKEASELDSVVLEDESLDLSTADTDGVTVKADLQDQYGENLDSETNVSVKTDDNEISVSDGPNSVSNGEVEFKVAAHENNAKKGNYEVTITAGEGENAVEKTLNVELVEHGVFDHYDVRGLENTVDLNENEDTVYKDDVNLSVVPVDENGYATSTGNDDPDYVIKDENGDTVTFENQPDEEVNAEFSDLDKTGNYTVEVSNDDSVVKKHSFEVVDTTETADVIFTSSDINLTEGNGQTDLNSALTDIAEIDGSKAESEAISGVEFISNAKNVIEQTGEGVTISQGEATIYVDTVEVDGNDIDMDNQPINVTVEK